MSTTKRTFKDVFRGMPVLVTGHTGFKGSWLSIWLRELGANVIGFSLVAPPTTPSNYEVSNLSERVTDIQGDIRDLAALHNAIETHKPRVVFHLAAQAIVLESHRQPKETFDANVGGTVNVLEAVRTTKSDSTRAVVCITSDKCYENQKWVWGYRENDALGGEDPYSASKGMAELSISSYRQSFFPIDKLSEHGVALASARAGNVIGGGDWGDDRLVPDCMRALLNGEEILLRNPGSIRPWQHVLEPLSGYLCLATKLLGERGESFAEPWNFGPGELVGVTTESVVQKAIEVWGTGSYSGSMSRSEADPSKRKIEMAVLRLTSDKAASRLNWHSVYDWQEAIGETVEWFKAYQERTRKSPPGDMYDICVRQIERYTARAREANVGWA
ncbi:MAG: CDP-glucose 4,6-dehydratase [Phycisphaerales bacterium]|nr:MAG: CDP-glucose 4,6-dehydratase [Phycisphaerales bacterium]